MGFIAVLINIVLIGVFGLLLEKRDSRDGLSIFGAIVFVLIIIIFVVEFAFAFFSHFPM